MPADKKAIRFLVNLDCYPQEAVYKAAYSLIDRAYLFLDSPGPKKIRVFLKGKTNLSPKRLENLKGEFFNELLNCTVRLNVARHNRKIRELIVSQAIVSAAGSQPDSAGPIEEQNDPLGIAVPWEEKYGQKSKKDNH